MNRQVVIAIIAAVKDRRNYMKKSGCLSTVAVIALIVLLIKIAPMLFTLIKIGMILSIVGIVALIVLVIYFSVRKDEKKQDAQPKTDATETVSHAEAPREEPDPILTGEQEEILKNGRAHLTEIRRQITHIGNIPIRTVSGKICDEADKILRTLRKKPDIIPRVRQFLNYYLPTLSSILEKYVRLEQNGVVAEDISDNTLEHLIDIKHAMEAQYRALFDDDKLDLTVEMEALKIACLRDGLLTEDDFEPKTENDTKPNLTL